MPGLMARHQTVVQRSQQFFCREKRRVKKIDAPAGHPPRPPHRAKRSAPLRSACPVRPPARAPGESSAPVPGAASAFQNQSGWSVRSRNPGARDAPLARRAACTKTKTNPGPRYGKSLHSMSHAQNRTRVGVLHVGHQSKTERESKAKPSGSATRRGVAGPPSRAGAHGVRRLVACGQPRRVKLCAAACARDALLRRPSSAPSTPPRRSARSGGILKTSR
jgi:hypothetical protein